jgi:hypothetical protein
MEKLFSKNIQNGGQDGVKIKIIKIKKKIKLSADSFAENTKFK